MPVQFDRCQGSANVIMDFTCNVGARFRWLTADALRIGPSRFRELQLPIGLFLSHFDSCSLPVRAYHPPEFAQFVFVQIVTDARLNGVDCRASPMAPESRMNGK